MADISNPQQETTWSSPKVEQISILNTEMILAPSGGG